MKKEKLIKTHPTNGGKELHHKVDMDFYDYAIEKIQVKRFFNTAGLEITEKKFHKNLEMLCDGIQNYKKFIKSNNNIDISNSLTAIRKMKNRMRGVERIQKYMKEKGDRPFKASIVMDLCDSDDMKNVRVDCGTYHELLVIAQNWIKKECSYYNSHIIEPIFSNHKILVVTNVGDERIVDKIIGFRFKTSKGCMTKRNAIDKVTEWSTVMINERVTFTRKLIYITSYLKFKNQ